MESDEPVTLLPGEPGGSYGRHSPAPPLLEKKNCQLLVICVCSAVMQASGSNAFLSM
jgi:hypothetical protein